MIRKSGYRKSSSHYDDTVSWNFLREKCFANSSKCFKRWKLQWLYGKVMNFCKIFSANFSSTFANISQHKNIQSTVCLITVWCRIEPQWENHRGNCWHQWMHKWRKICRRLTDKWEVACVLKISKKSCSMTWAVFALKCSQLLPHSIPSELIQTRLSFFTLKYHLC